MSEGTIRINKVLREFNISLERAVDFLKDKGFTIESNPNTKITEEIYGILSNQFAGDKGNKDASKEVGEEKRKEKEALRLEREHELEQKRIEEERARQEVIKAKAAALSGPKKVGKIDLNPKPVVKPEVEAPKVEVEPVAKEVSKPVIQEKPVEKIEPKQEKPVEVKVKPVVVPPVEKKVEKVVEKPQLKEVKPIVEPKVETKTDKPATSPSVEAGQVVEERYETQYQKLSGATFTGQKIDLSQFEKPKKKKEDSKPNQGGNNNHQGGDANKKKRNRIPSKQNNQSNKPDGNNNNGQGNRGNQGANHGNKGGNKFNKKAPVVKVEPTEEEVKNQIKETLERLQGKGNKSKAAKYRRDKRDSHRERNEAELAAQEEGSKVLKVTEFVTVGEIATMMDVPITKVIGTCMSLGIMVTMNQRLDAETLTIVTDEFGYEVQFTTADIEETIEVVEDKPEDLKERAPIVTVMGHVDHGKTSLLDYIRKTNVIAGESGGITQHIGAYGVELENGQEITFLDTPGHEAFTAMRARGAQVTDIAIIVVAADDDIMPQTKEAISHAQAAGVPIIFAINKIDKATANPDKIKEKLAAMNFLVEEWGGKYQSHDISAKMGIGVKELLEKVLLEAEILELKANPDKPAVGTVVEAFLDKGRGYVSTILVQAGTLKIGDYVLAGKHHGKIRAMQDERGHSVKEAGPSTPVSILGLDGAPTAGDKFNVFEDEREAKQIAAKRTQLLREQSVRTQRHITLDEIGRRIALGQFKELNIILKGDVDGSVEALSDSFSKLSTEEIQINIIHKGVGAITESDVMLASASDAIIIGFNVRPQGNAKSLAEKEEIDIRHYSIIYAAIDDLRDAMEGMLSPEFKEEITGTAEIRELFKISKVGTIAGCMVTDGKIFKSNKIRLIREGVVIYTGELLALKRFKDDVKEVSKGYDCGMQIKGYNDIQEYDVIEGFTTVEVKKKLK
ncbi:translation initiation factor IF-2 [Flavobacterium columnare NBRC 100251 = ATCC 23463]|uniref:Translation initiation factor IF-2 n=1 Tax=Flavobacterium columnare (strain ATCC 49512 / CIP 103533 / TG 44/87) TaxID=1041826 RepID=G8X5M3_FLACA|nr:translation initiation factor IF-2 [Flavobacterium columnare]AEW86867.1 translation initiation factor IF-2 [Flavobacterium columnare ATCC 49512]ANO47294.1 translation initiation factor IF-2 [Flavobacterium columnare]APT22042.1 translation initiation factor IF-2 [Flavobacterium columnare]MBF6653403.1 translation initiation factor IF-2 [Flavobacterium columnare]MBF6655806.1 translation initiation factor IF-2 [Flavobacterium columnare]